MRNKTKQKQKKHGSDEREEGNTLIRNNIVGEKFQSTPHLNPNYIPAYIPISWPPTSLPFYLLKLFKSFSVFIPLLMLFFQLELS